jgi:hypothetical protein
MGELSAPLQEVGPALVDQPPIPKGSGGRPGRLLRRRRTVNPNCGAFSETNKFTGHELEDESGLDYMQARYQKPEVGRFVS